METGRVTLSHREWDRLKVLHEVKQKHLSQVAAAMRLKVTDRQVRRMLRRIRERGDGALVHGLRGRPSNRKLAARLLEQKILARLRQRYADFGPTLAAEHLAQEGFSVSRETLRKWMTKAALWCPRSQRVKAVHVWRERRACFGELVMQDSSPFRWLEDRGPACHLIALIDDATSRVWGRFTEHDTTEKNLRTLRGWLRRSATSRTTPGRSAANAVRASLARPGDRMDRGTQSAGERTDRATIRNTARPLGKGNAVGRDRQPRCRKSFFGDAFSSGLGRAFHGGTSQAAQCAPTVSGRTAIGRNSQRARGSPGSRRSHRQLGWNALGCPARRSVRGSSRRAGGNRTTTGWLALATLPRPLSPPAPLPGTPAPIRKSFRPTASRTCGTNTRTQKQNQSKYGGDLGGGHFYFALTALNRSGSFRGNLKMDIDGLRQSGVESVSHTTTATRPANNTLIQSTARSGLGFGVTA
jgi:transposase